MNNSINRLLNEQLKKFGINILVNEKETKALFKEIDNKNGYDEKYMFTQLSTVKQGDIINFNNTNYLIMSKDNNIGQTYDKTVICRLAHAIRIYIDNELIEIPVLVQTFTQSVRNYTNIRIAEGNLLLTMQLNKYTRKIGYNKRILIMSEAWKVVGFTNETESILNLSLLKTDFDKTDDNLELEIANYWTYNKRHDYKLTVEPSNITLKVGESAELKATLKDNNENVDNVVYKIENSTDIISVQKSTVVALKEGVTQIRVIALVDNVEVASVNINIAIEVIPDPPQSSHTIKGDTTTYRIRPKQYIVVDNKSVKAIDKWIFTVDKDIVEIKVVDDATVELTPKDNGNIVLTATNEIETITKNIACRMRF